MKDKVKALRKSTGMTQAAFSEKYGIPKRTLENWEGGVNKPPEYVYKMLERLVELEKE